MLFAYHRFWPLLHAGFGSFFASLVSLFGFLSLTLFYGFLAQGAIPFVLFSTSLVLLCFGSLFYKFFALLGCLFLLGSVFCIFVLFHSLILDCLFRSLFRAFHCGLLRYSCCFVALSRSCSLCRHLLRASNYLKVGAYCFIRSSF